MVCRKCGSELSDGARYCLVCGTEVRDVSAEVPPEKPSAQDSSQAKASRHRPKREAAWICAALVILAAAAVLLIRYGNARHTAFVPYVREGGLYQADLMRSSGKIRYFEHAVLPDNAVGLVQYTSDASWIAYPGEAGRNGSFRLYLQRTRSGKASCVAENAVEYLLLDSGKLLYLDSENVLLFAGAKDEAVILDSAVQSFWSDEAGKNAVWVRQESGENKQMYAQDLTLKQDRILLMDGFDDYIQSPDRKSYAYLSGDELWYSFRLEEAERIDRNVSELGYLLDSGAVYYACALDDSMSYYDVVDDNLALADATRLLSKDRPNEAYEAAAAREALRAELKSNLIADRYGELYSFDRRGDQKRIGVGKLRPGDGAAAGGIDYQLIGLDEKQISMRELSELYLETGDLERSLFRNTLRLVSLSPASSTGYFLTLEEDSEDTYELRSYSVSRGMDRTSLISDRVHSIMGLEGDAVWYLADYDGESALLCKDDEVVAQGVSVDDWLFTENGFCCFTDWDASTRSGTLNYWDGKKLSAVGEHVSADFITILPDGICYVSMTGPQRFTLNVYDSAGVSALGEDAYAYYPCDAKHVAYLAGRDRTLYGPDGSELDTGVGQILEQIGF